MRPILRPALLTCVLALSVPVQAGLAPDSYHESIRCAALDTLVVGVAGDGDDNQMSDGDKALVSILQNHAIGWLQRAASQAPAGKDTSRADFSAELSRLSTQFRQMKQDGKDSADVREDLRHCLARGVELFGSEG